MELMLWSPGFVGGRGLVGVRAPGLGVALRLPPHGFMDSTAE